MTTEPRSCGSCSLCCKVLTIEPPLSDPQFFGDGGKARGSWCKHCSKPGCRVYEDRPPACAAFRCLWLQGHLPEWMFPKNSKWVGFEQDDKLMFMGDPDFIKGETSITARVRGLFNSLSMAQRLEVFITKPKAKEQRPDCNSCDGTGVIYGRRCAHCEGTGEL